MLLKCRYLLPLNKSGTAFTVDFQVNSATVPVITTRASERGSLVGLSVEPFLFTIGSGRFWCKIGVMIGGELREHIYTVLCDGYVSSNGSVSWTGDMVLDSGWYLFCYALSNVLMNGRFTGIIKQEYD